MRHRFLKDLGAGFSDYELVELILFSARPRSDVKPLAKALIGRFGSFADLIAAEPAAIRAVGDVGDSTVTALKVIHTAALRLARSQVLDRPVISSWQQLLDYCYSAMARESREQLRLLYLDRKNKLIDDEIHQTGTIDHAPVYPREIVKRALDLGASAIIMVHNHPSGDPTPSRGDIDMTREVQAAAEKLGITLHDHLVIGRSGHASFKSLGLL